MTRTQIYHSAIKAWARYYPNASPIERSAAKARIYKLLEAS